MTRRLACAVDDLSPGSSRSVPGQPQIALFRTEDGEFYATDDSCTHEQWSLGSDGDLDGAEVTCPLHMAAFDLRTGKALCLPATEPLRTYPVEIDGDQVFVIVSDGT